jgi:hypothetical protein
MTEDESSQRLRQLLRLKRHESPPPGYFRDFPGAVVERIQALEAERSIPMWRRWWFRGGESLSGPSDDRMGFRFLWAGGTVGALVVAVLMGGLHWLGRSSGTEDAAGGLAHVAPPGHTAFGTGLATPQGSRAPAIALAGIDAGWKTSGNPGARAGDPQWNAGFGWPVSVSMATTGSGVPPELSSTNPFPPGLFRLPGSAGPAGPEVYRVRFGDSQR